MLSGFDPVVDQNCTVLILGSLPSVQSIQKQEYYGNPHNRFWHYIFLTFNETATDNYEQKRFFTVCRGKV